MQRPIHMIRDQGMHHGTESDLRRTWACNCLVGMHAEWIAAGPHKSWSLENVRLIRSNTKHRLFLNGAYFENPSAELRLFMNYIRTLDGPDPSANASEHAAALQFALASECTM